MRKIFSKGLNLEKKEVKMMKRLFIFLFAFVLTVAIAGLSHAALLTFDDLIIGATTYSFDGDGDGMNDVIFSTTDPYGFNTVGPGQNMTYIQEPGLEGTSLLNPDLRVDFLVGAIGSLKFGFALDSSTEDDTASFQVFDGVQVTCLPRPHSLASTLIRMA